MQLSNESLHPVTRTELGHAVLNFEGASIAPSPATSPAHDPVAQARASASIQRVACRSFHVSGAQVDVQRVLFGILPWLSAERCDVENVSKGGVSFESRLLMHRGESVELKLRVPGEREPVSLKGEVRWCKRARYGGYRVGVQFAPYGSSARRNPRSALQALRAIEAKHA